MERVVIMAKQEIEEGKAPAILSYLLVGIIWFFADEKIRNNSFTKFHVKQGLVLLIAAVVYSIALEILLSIILFPVRMIGLGWEIGQVLSILYYVPIVFIIIGIINALNGSEKELPVIGHFAKNFKF